MTQRPSFCGQTVQASQLRLICECVQRYPGLSREELASTLCEWLQWVRPNGSLKTRECRTLLLDLHQRSVITLPRLRPGRPRGSHTTIPRTAQGEAGRPLHVTLEAVQPIRIQRVEQPSTNRLWRELVGRYHYLGYRMPYGASIRYLIESGAEKRKLGCLQFSSAAWQIKARDEWIGWDPAQRKRQLPRLINNSRFLILPWVQIPNLVSHVMALALRTVIQDWQSQFGTRPWLAETLVDSQRFTGHCYRAANWIRSEEHTSELQSH